MTYPSNMIKILKAALQFNGTQKRDLPVPEPITFLIRDEINAYRAELERTMRQELIETEKISAEEADTVQVFFMTAEEFHYRQPEKEEPPIGRILIRTKEDNQISKLKTCDYDGRTYRDSRGKEIPSVYVWTT